MAGKASCKPSRCKSRVENASSGLYCALKQVRVTTYKAKGVMMNRLSETATVQCPYCWQEWDMTVDCSLARQEYVEDCPVCCRPVVLTITVVNGAVSGVDARGEGD